MQNDRRLLVLAVSLAWLGLGGPPSDAADGPPRAGHWAFQPLTRPPLPSLRDASRVRTPVDRFIQAALEANQLTLGPDADRHTLIRRVSFDLTGLPPTPQEIAEFVADLSLHAYERMVERYLASPHYGQRWGK